MSNVVVVGTQWGDEGKGKVVDVLSPHADAVVRFQGGNNAGHTLVVQGDQLILHLLPSGVLRPSCTCVIGNGVVVDPAVLLDELALLEQRGVQIEAGRLVVSARAHVVMPWHVRLDQLRERAMGDNRIGTTCRGIGPTYEDKAARRGIRMADLIDPERLAARVRAELPDKNLMIVDWLGGEALDADVIVERYAELGARLAPYVGDVSGLLQELGARGRSVLFEGAQGTFLDVDQGTYPYVTSSNTVAGAACTGAGVGPTAIDEVVGIVKAYTTRVGAGAFPTEDEGAAGERLRAVGHEFGATTGRPRRCGWFDAVLVRQAAHLNGLTHLALTKLDVLSGIDPIPVCVAYEGAGGFPLALEAARPVYEELEGWHEPLDDCRTLEDLPDACRRYVARLEELVGVPVGLISVGPGRDQTLLVADLFGGHGRR